MQETKQLLIFKEKKDILENPQRKDPRFQRHRNVSSNLNTAINKLGDLEKTMPSEQMENQK